MLCVHYAAAFDAQEVRRRLPIVPSALRMTFAFEPSESTKVILLPAAILCLHPEKSAHVNGHDADINCVVDRKEHEIISKDQRDMDQGADGENQEMHQHLDV